LRIPFSATERNTPDGTARTPPASYGSGAAGSVFASNSISYLAITARLIYTLPHNKLEVLREKRVRGISEEMKVQQELRVEYQREECKNHLHWSA
jgi:hypothetical protein